MGAQGSCRIKCNGWWTYWGCTGRNSSEHRAKYFNLCFLITYPVCIDESQNSRTNSRDFSCRIKFWIAGRLHELNSFTFQIAIPNDDQLFLQFLSEGLDDRLVS